MGTWQKIITGANDSTHLNSNVDIDDLGGTSGSGSLTNFLNQRGTFTQPAGTADTNQLTTFTVSASTDTNATTISQGDDLMFTGGDGITAETTADGTVTFVNTKPNLVQTTVSGNAGTVTNGVYTSGTQTIADIKTFSSKIAGSITGNCDGNSATTSETTITSAQASAISANTSKTGISSAQTSAITANTSKTGISSAQASAITANTAKTSYTDSSAVSANTAKTGISSAQTSAITANTAKTGISSAQASAITANTSKTGISSAQTSAISANTSKTGISSAQASAITANTAKTTDQGQVSCTTANIKSALNADTGGLTIGDSNDTIVISGNLTINGTTTTKDSSEVNIGDAILTLNYAETGTPSEDAGIDIERGTSTNSYMRWDESATSWIMSNGTSTANLTSSYIASAVSPPNSSSLFRVGDLWMAGTVPWLRTA